MVSRQISYVIERLRRDLTADLTDGQLLERFIAHREEAAFETLVRRHGPLVWGVCRGIVRDHHDAEDCFQAVFLVLARKAASIASRELLANWLYGVAHNVARKAEAVNMKRRAREKQGTEIPEPAAAESLESDLKALLDLELRRLPEKYRVPILLCELQGKSHREAAQQLGWPIGTLSGRLSRAKTMLAANLARRGLAVSAGALGVLAAQEMVSAAVVISTVRLATGQVSQVPAGVADLAEGVLKAMLLHKLRNIALVALVAAATFGGWGVLAGSSSTTTPTRPEARPVSVVQPAGEAKPQVSQPKIVIGDNYLVFPVTTELQRFMHGGRTGARVFVDGPSIVRSDGTLDAKALDFRKLREALKPYDRKGDVIFMACYGNPAFPDGNESTDASNVLRWALEGFARQEGFASAKGYDLRHNDRYDWKAQVVSASKVASASKDDVDVEEPSSGNKLVKVFPVRTAISRELTGADCVVEILPPSDKWENGELSQEIQDAIQLYVDKLKLPRKGNIHFQIYGRTPENEVGLRFVQITAPALAKSLGFENSSIGN
jgi:RNA polymerase sigma factor (sigma-70 family)